MNATARVIVALLALTCSGWLRAQVAEDDYLDVSIRVFEPTAAAPATESVAADTPASAATSKEVSLAEVRYLPMYLRYRLEASQLFGAVRVLPVLDNGAQLTIEGRILKSDGASLELAITARDSTGRLWLDKTYAGTAVASASVSDDELAQDDFAYLFGDILRDLTTTLQQLTPAQIEEIHTVALLRYGFGLAPQSFATYLQEGADGTVSISRLPAANDPLLASVEEIREHEYLFIDVVDQEYQQFYADIQPVYAMWRRFQREQAESVATFETREATSESTFRRGSYYALQESYNNYRWAKVQEVYLDELSEGFANEVEPTEIELSDSLYKLTGTLEQQYREWRSILAEMLALETQ